MSFTWPVLLLAVLLVPAGAWLAMRVERGRRARAASLGGALGAGGAGGSGGRGRTRAVLDALPAVLVVAALVVMVFGLARPQATVALPRLEGTLMLVFDVSGSMAADDVAPSRMEAAKAIATTIVERRPEGVVIGVVAFSDAGVAVQAPTSDTVAVEAAIARLVPARGTSLGSGILSAIAAIDEARAATPAEYYSNRSPAPSVAPEPVPPGSDAATMIVVLSDGENTENPDPEMAARTAADRGIRIAAIGVGTPGGSVLDLDGFQVETRLDEASLRRLADVTAGSYAAIDAPAAAADPSAVPDDLTDPADPAAGVAGPAGAAADRVYGELARALVVREEPVELTALAAAVAMLLLLAGSGLSLARSGRLP